MSLLTNKGKEAISTAISSSSQFSLVRIGFGDKQGSINRKFVESDTSLVNEKFRINLDSVYYLPTVDNNTILKITANLTPEQSATMEAVTVREFGIYDNFNNLLIVGDTVPTITKDSNNNNGIDFEINLTLPTSEKVAKVLVTSKEGEFSNAERIKLNNIEDEATKNKTDSFLLDRKNHTGKIDIENVDGLVAILDSLETVEDNDDKLSGKVDKVTGKGLSTNDYTDMEKDKLNSIDVESLEKVVNDVTKLKSDFNTLVIKEELFVTLEDYVIKVPGKDLSSNDYTDVEKDKLASIDINKINNDILDLESRLDNDIFVLGNRVDNIDNDIFDLEKRPYFMGRFQDEDEMLSLFFYDGNEEDDKKPIYNDMYYYNIGLNSVMYYNGGTWIKGSNLNIVDDLNSTVPGSVLDANQGRILKGLIDNITTILNSDETNLDTLQEIVDFIKINRDTLNALTISSIAGLQNALDNKLDKNQNAISATKLETARTIGGVSFDGTANINLPGVNTAGNQSTTGNSATATKLATPVKINNKLFDGSTNINLEEDAMVVKEKVVNLTGDIIQTSLGSVFIKTITKNTTLSLTTNYNIGETNSFILELTNGGNYTINWWDNIKWNGGVAPELTNNGKDILGFYSYDSPRVTIGVVLSKDAK